MQRWKTVATDIYRGIKTLGLNWDGIAESEIGLARAIANNYNTIKHPKGAFPDPHDTRLLSDISSFIVRLNALKLVTDDATMITGPTARQPLERTIQIFREDRIVIDQDGKFISLAEETPG